MSSFATARTHKIAAILTELASLLILCTSIDNAIAHDEQLHQLQQQRAPPPPPLLPPRKKKRVHWEPTTSEAAAAAAEAAAAAVGCGAAETATMPAGILKMTEAVGCDEAEEAAEMQLMAEAVGFGAAETAAHQMLSEWLSMAALLSQLPEGAGRCGEV